MQDHKSVPTKIMHVPYEFNAFRCFTVFTMRTFRDLDLLFNHFL